MFCPSCGAESVVGLNYCNRCGGSLSTLTTQPQIVQINVTKPTLIIGAVLTLLTLGGFAGLIAGALALSRVARGGGDDFLAVPVFGMFFICLIDILLIRQLSKIISASVKSPGYSETRGLPASPQVMPQLSRPTTAQLTPAPSVTEHTTRFFDQAYRAPVNNRPAGKPDE